MEYAMGCMPTEALSAGAYHKRDRLWFVADRNDKQRRLEQRLRGRLSPHLFCAGVSMHRAFAA